MTSKKKQQENQSINQSIDGWVGLQAGQPISQSINLNQSINESTCQNIFTTLTEGRWSASSDVADVDDWLPVTTIARIRRTFSASDSADWPDTELMRLFFRWCGVSRLCNLPSFSVKSSDSAKPTLRVLPPSSSSSPSFTSSYTTPDTVPDLSPSVFNSSNFPWCPCKRSSWFGNQLYSKMIKKCQDSCKCDLRSHR